MNQLKKLLGIIWMSLAPALIVFMFWQAYEKISTAAPAAKSNTTLQWVIILLVFLPICAGLFMFGLFAWTNEYAHLPESSGEIDDYDMSPID
jgi:hypothetical protein